MTGIARLKAVVLDCPDPQALAAFYAELTGAPIVEVEDDWVDLADDGAGVRLSFQLAPDYQAPTWPDPTRPQQFHLDLDVPADGVDAAEEKLLALGATKPETQPGGQWRVYLDPVGHPFCLCWD
ncbi:VOC family protein [Actinocatenispora rupis]|uniref:Glyoxalase n=1 Tax=Actinocatenispora rupis TaxID=519421 RepID=A0A8J3IUY0_9ACTN|nr:VOC family protein [Actinocatenispora rupis]GID09233.1 glyoxalase [Actinocatenispora rupis]